jgi:hypothetical protein
MIVVRRGAGLVLVTQSDHAHFAAELLSLWRLEGFPAHPRRDDILFAVREHDNGWREEDAVPRLDAAGRPLDFRQAALPERIEVWQRGIERHAETRPYAARLIAEHALALHRDRAGEDWELFRRSLEELSGELDAMVPGGTATALEDYRYLAWADAAALAAVGVWPEFDSELGRGQLRDSDLHLDPFPFVGVTTFSMACRTVPDRVYGSVLDLASTLAESRWSELRLRGRPW